MNVSSRYWSSIDVNECVFRVNEQQKVYKIVRKTSPAYPSNLLPMTVRQRSRITLRSANDFSLFPARTERYRKSFFPFSTRLWNTLDSELGEALFRFFNTSRYNKLFDYSIDRYTSRLHTRLRLNCCALRLLPFTTRNKTFIYILEHSITRWRFYFDERRSIRIISLFINAICIIMYSQ